MILFDTLRKAVSNKTTLIKGSSLKAHCVRSSVVLGIGAFVAKFLGFGSKVVLTRLLVPQVMGLMVLILSITSLLEVLAEIGLKQSVIQNKKGARSEFLNITWWFQILRGAGLYAVGFFVAPLLCRFYFANKPEILTLYRMPELVALVRTAFLTFLFWGIASPRAYVLEKEFRFGKTVFLNQGSAILGSVITIVLAFVMRNIWAVIIGFISMGVLRCLFSYILCPFRPRLSFDRPSFKEILEFSRGMLGLPILTYIAFNIDILVAGKLVSADLFGMYGMALVLARAPWDLFGRIINPVLLPAFAEKQDDKGALCKAVLKITKFTTLFGFPLVALAIICSKTILSLVFGEQYSAVAVPFSLLCIYVLLIIQSIILSNVFFALGQPEKQRLFVVSSVLTLIILIYPAVKTFGPTGAALSLLIANFVALCLQIVVIRKTIRIKIREYIFGWLPGLGLSLFVFLFVRLLRYIQ